MTELLNPAVGPVWRCPSLLAARVLEGVSQDVAQPLADYQVFAFLQSHRHDLKLIRSAGQCLFLRPAFVNDRQQAGVAGRQHFDARIASAELLIAFLDTEPELFLVFRIL